MEEILESFLDSKEDFKERITKLEEQFKQNNDEKIEQELEQLRYETDNKILDLQQKISYTEEKPLEVLLPPGNHFFVKVFEENSLSMIKSALITEDLVAKSTLANYDYSLCAVGYWKALEIELNIVVADAIRYFNEYINRIPSKGKSLRKDPLYVEGLRNNGKVTEINVNSYRKNQLKDLMFGEMIQLLDYSERNRYKEIFDRVTPHLNSFHQKLQYKKNLLDDLKIIVYEYRNKGSHTSTLKKEDLEQVKDILFKHNGLYHRIAKIKEYLLEQNSMKSAN